MAKLTSAKLVPGSQYQIRPVIQVTDQGRLIYGDGTPAVYQGINRGNSLIDADRLKYYRTMNSMPIGFAWQFETDAGETVQLSKGQSQDPGKTWGFFAGQQEVCIFA